MSGTTTPVVYGKEGDTYISGCKFISPDRTSIAFFREKERKIYARELGTEIRGRGLVLSVKEANLLGCGDVDGDKIDELIFQVPGSNANKHGILVVNLKGVEKSYKNVSTFVKGLVIRRVGENLPLVATISGIPSGRQALNLMSVSGEFKFPVIGLSAGTRVSAGVFVRKGGDAQPAVFWSDPKRLIKRQFITENSSPEALFSLPKKLRLIQSQNFSRTANFRN